MNSPNKLMIDSSPVLERRNLSQIGIVLSQMRCCSNTADKQTDKVQRRRRLYRFYPSTLVTSIINYLIGPNLFNIPKVMHNYTQHNYKFFDWCSFGCETDSSFQFVERDAFIVLCSHIRCTRNPFSFSYNMCTVQSQFQL